MPGAGSGRNDLGGTGALQLMTATVTPMSELAARPRVGSLLRDWRVRRRLSQLDLALGAGVSARHVSFVETARSRPSAGPTARFLRAWSERA
jgi:predicted transcriptional regulator